mmetsp:Transcript_88057/g.146449  ORF Transcript_88057/g.146449 Transcript_88057/m.146449 type:complete len:245 (+) Transcript_88057:452-1186(+)
MGAGGDLEVVHHILVDGQRRVCEAVDLEVEVVVPRIPYAERLGTASVVWDFDEQWFHRQRVVIHVEREGANDAGAASVIRVERHLQIRDVGAARDQLLRETGHRKRANLQLDFGLLPAIRSQADPANLKESTLVVQEELPVIGVLVPGAVQIELHGDESVRVIRCQRLRLPFHHGLDGGGWIFLPGPCQGRGDHMGTDRGVFLVLRERHPHLVLGLGEEGVLCGIEQQFHRGIRRGVKGRGERD